MATQASWHTFSWGYSSGVLRALEELSTERSVSVERNADKEGEPATQTVALDLIPLKFSYRVSAYAGGDPRGEFGALWNAVGVHAPFYLNGRRFLCDQMLLKKASASDWEFDPQGRAVFVKISLEFEEYAEDASGLKLNKVESAGSLRPGVQTQADVTSAISIAPTSEQKAAHTVANGQMARW